MLPFDELQRKANERYYRQRGRALYSDFKTFGSSDKIANANALDFHEHLKEYDAGGEIKAYDFGIGNGLFSRFFLEKFRSLDPGREFFPRLSYFLCDISEELVKKAEKELDKAGFPVRGIACDATGPLKFLKSAAYIRSNEMYDDLPAKIFVKQDGKLFEVFMDERREEEYAGCRNAEAAKLMESMPEGYWIPLNYGAALHLKRSIRGLARNGYLDIFDYGFASLEEITGLPPEVWNNAIVREFNTQLTIDVNFIHLSAAARASGAVPSCEPQKEYAEKTLGGQLLYVEGEQLYYYNEAEFRKALPKLKKFGYSKDFLTSGLTESDDYMHFRVRKG